MDVQVLFQQKYIANMPDKVKALIKVSITGRELTPADWDQLFRVAKKIWLVLAIVGAGIDIAAAVKAVRALAPAAKALEAGGTVADFRKAVEALEKSKQLERQAAEAADKAAAAREAYKVAKGEFGAALGKAYSFPGPLLDPEVYRAVVKMALAKLREGGHSLVSFLAEVRAARITAKLGDLTPEELARVKQAWEEAEVIKKSAEVPVEITSDAGRVIGRY